MKHHVFVAVCLFWLTACAASEKLSEKTSGNPLASSVSLIIDPSRTWSHSDIKVCWIRTYQRLDPSKVQDLDRFKLELKEFISDRINRQTSLKLYGWKTCTLKDLGKDTIRINPFTQGARSLVGPPSKSGFLTFNAKTPHQKAATMHIGFANWQETPKATLNAALHEFEHAFGMIHPHAGGINVINGVCLQKQKPHIYKLATLMNYCHFAAVSGKRIDRQGFHERDDLRLVSLQPLDVEALKAYY